MCNLAISPFAGAETDPRLLPWIFRMTEVDQPLRSAIAVMPEHRINRCPLLGVERFRTTAREILPRDEVAAPMMVVNRRNHGAVCPRLNDVRKQRFLVPN